jgi:NADH:ubiquinone oxidoreductase subunit H
MKKNGKLLKVVLYSIMAAIFFFGGWTIRENHDRQEAFLRGYETATNHIAHTIRNRMFQTSAFVSFRLAQIS